MTRILSRLVWGLLWGWVWAVGSLALSLEAPGWAGRASLPMVVAGALALGHRAPGGVLGAVVASALLDAWSLRIPFLESVVVFGTWVGIARARRTFEVVTIPGEAALLGGGFALAEACRNLLTLLLDRTVPGLFPDRLILGWALQTGAALILARALPLEPEGNRVGRTR